MGATLRDSGQLGAREVMIRPGADRTDFNLTPDNSRQVSLGVMTQDQFDALFPPAGTGGTGAVSAGPGPVSAGPGPVSAGPDRASGPDRPSGTSGTDQPAATVRPDPSTLNADA